ncbi:beta-ketoacyl-ACP synthase I [Methylobacillus gramineus]|uniref:beta-ketoacyl synthase N-terminal-like domain-containing protein n=1 Tax=Methylobacillus gramineus TaxID=755169 RepID=UPI001CFF7519|nr:beta-ketoacyl synthase N-terminal-like domain-containing protein [Methylobacillus gramineus]MCB5183721.1 beta-ketoacyl-ACP synthase I [Methylobacillus gramineus]
MRRVVITGMGIVSCLGNDIDTVSASLQQGRSGLRHMPEYAAMGLRSQVAGVPDISSLPPVNRKHRRFMADTALYAYHAAQQAIHDSQLPESLLTSPRTGMVIGSGVGSPWEHVQAMDTLRNQGLSKVLPYAVPRIMGSTASATLSTAFSIKGISCSITSACASSGHCIGYGTELIQFGKQDIMIVGGSEETSWATTAPFDAMGALSTRYNDATASRPYHQDRDGFVIAGGAGILILEELEHAQQRGAHIYAEITGYGACSDGLDMVTPSAAGAARAMRLAIAGLTRSSSIDYINTHATSTPLGDICELHAIREVFGDKLPLISSTKGLSGHPIGAAAAHEAIYSLLMMRDGFVAGCANLDTPDPQIGNMPVLRANLQQPIRSAMSNSFGFGGTNVSLVFQSL